MSTSNDYPNLTRAGKGRPRGSPNRITKAMVELMERVLNDPDYQARLIERIKAGRARHIEELFMLHALGRPSTSVELTAEVRRPRAEVHIMLPAKLDFVQLRSIAERFSEAFQQCAWDFNQISFLVGR